MLTQEELSLARDEVEAFFPYVCDIYKTTGADDPYGGRDRTHGVNPTYTGVKCSLIPGAAHDQEVALLGRDEALQIFNVALPAFTDINVGDHLKVTTEDHPSLHLRVQAELSPEEFELERRVVATEIGVATHG